MPEPIESVMTMLTNNTPTALFFAIVVCAVGCSDSPVPKPDASSQQAMTSTKAALEAPKPAALTLRYGLLLDGNNVQSINDPSVEVIEKHFRDIDWQNAGQPGYISLVRPGVKGASSIAIKGTMGTPNDGIELMAVVYLYDADGSISALGESRLKSVDETYELWMLFQNDIEKLKSIVLLWQQAADQ